MYGQGYGGKPGSLNGDGMSKYIGGKGLGNQSPVSGGAKASSLSANRHPKREIKFQKTPRDGPEHREGEADAQGTGGKRNKTPTTQER